MLNNLFKNMDYSISIKNHHPENLVGGFACPNPLTFIRHKLPASSLAYSKANV